MPKMDIKKTRRSFLKTAGKVGTGTLLASMANLANASEKTKVENKITTKMPTRLFGKTGEEVSILSLGGVLDMSDQIVFRQAINMGVTYWDTAEGYRWGKNEKAIGKYFNRFPDDRKKVFLVTKGGTSDPAALTEKLNDSLRRMNTSYVDMYFIHYVSDVKDELTKNVRQWAEKAKASGKIRFFGFSAHKNMEDSMLAAAKLGWIDGIMMSYNYRLMVKDDMRKAVDACVEAGIGLTAMKTQAAFSANFYASIGSETDEALKMTENFLKKGYTAEQANLKVVWENRAIASICSAMPNMTILQANVAAASNQNSLSQSDKQILNQYAQQTSSGYCAGCAHICESATDVPVPISDIFRYSMYKNSYGDQARAQSLFHKLPVSIRKNILCADYTKAERSCPQRIEISKMIKEEYEAFTKPGQIS
jgi:predicted aldo/keto reductase-like oxidoreductase